ncbi:hypothetical protein [Aliiglaciecola aliphaticivorans]
MNNNPTSSSEDIVDSEVSNLYQSQNKPAPSQLVDSHILTLAKQRIDAKNQPTKWRQWQWPASIAASVMFISLVVYTQYEQFDPRFEQAPQADVDSYEIADQATLDEREGASKAKLQTKDLSKPSVSTRMASAPLPQKEEFTEQQLDEPERAQYAEKEALTLAAKAMDNVEIEPLALELELPLKVEVDEQIPEEIALSQEEAEQMALKKADLLARQATEQSAKKEQQANKRLSILDTAAAFSDIQDSKSKIQVNTEYLDNLLKKLEGQAALTNSDSFKSKELKRLQGDIFDYLSLLKMSDPLVEIDEKYWKVLTQEQQEKLAK